MGLDDRDPPEPLRDEGEAAVEAVAQEARKTEVTVTTAVRHHTPHEGVRTYAYEHQVDVSITSSRGHSGISRAQFGSVTERVLRLTERPGLVVRRDRTEESSE